MDLFETVAGRRSVRKYAKTPIDQDKLLRVLEAARLAPSAANRQPWKIYVVTDERLREALGNAYHNAWFYEAPVIIAICSCPGRAWSRSDGKNYADVDAAIAFDHLTLAAQSEGLATCWIGAFTPSVVVEALGLPPGEEPLAMTPLGYPAQAPAMPPRRPLDELVEMR